jgi:hypothetical protein
MRDTLASSTTQQLLQTSVLHLKQQQQVRSARRTPPRQSSASSRSSSYNTANFTGLSSGNQQTNALSPGSAATDRSGHVSIVNGHVNGKPAPKLKRRSLLRRADSLAGLFLEPDRRRDLQRLSVQLSLPLSLIVARVEALVASTSSST